MSDGIAIQKPVATAVGANAYLISANAQRLIITGQIGIRPDGVLEKGLKAQLERAFHNVIALCEAAGFRKDQIVRVTAIVTEPGRFAVFREARQQALGDHQCPTIYMQVSGLAAPALLCELQAEAVQS